MRKSTFSDFTCSAPWHDKIDCTVDISANGSQKHLFCFLIRNAVCGIPRLFCSLFSCREHNQEPGLSVPVNSVESTEVFIVDIDDTIVLPVNIFENIGLLLVSYKGGHTWK